MIWTVELAAFLDDAPWPATKEELIEYADRIGAPYEVIENLKGKITVFIIAHRLSTIINSDILLILNEGKIVEQGKPADLLKSEAWKIRFRNC